jgi:hypothetical protein
VDVLDIADVSHIGSVIGVALHSLVETEGCCMLKASAQVQHCVLRLRLTTHTLVKAADGYECSTRCHSMTTALVG